MMLLLSAPGAFYSFKVASIDGGKINFADYKGKKILIVNTASQCGNTPQYADLEKLYQKYQGKLVIVGFPANNFHEQKQGPRQDNSNNRQEQRGPRDQKPRPPRPKGKE